MCIKTTIYGNTLTIVKSYKRHDGKRNRNVVDVTCDKCSEDTELFPKPFTLRKCEYAKGSVPCGCSKNYSYDLRQTEILLIRDSDSSGYDFVKWCKVNEKVPLKSYPVLRCIEHKTLSSTSQAKDCLRSNSFGCKICKVNKISAAQRISDEDMTKRLLSTGVYEEGTVFKRSQESTRLWEYTCPTCSNDKFVKFGLCSGIFFLDQASLHINSKSCRCGRGYSWTRDQREFSIKEALNKRNVKHEFLGWVGEYSDSHSKFKYDCGRGHGIQEVEVAAYLNNNCDCRDCSLLKSENFLGLYSQRLYENDHLYLVKLSNDKESFLKVGRAFNLKVRFGFYKPLFDVELLSYFNANHVVIHHLEKVILKEYSDLNYKPLTFFEGRTECFNLNLQEEVENYAYEYLGGE